MKRNLAALDKQTFDLLVCGGGIYGVWTAYDAALRGLKVALVEQGDWGHATSSASSKLVHGGLRYLERYEFGLVRKTLIEREMLIKNAPHRVWPLRFGVPVYADSRIDRLRLKLGLTVYDWLATGQPTSRRHHYYNRMRFSEHFPFLHNQTLKGGFTYADAQTDDARMVLELVDGAMQAGAVCVNYCALTDLLTSDGLATGAQLQDQVTEQIYEVQAHQIVFATGQWMAADDQRPDNCLLTRGIHLIMPRLPQEEALLLTARSDGRVFFVIPWYGLTLLGTTDTDYQGSLDRIEIDVADIDYLLDAVNGYLQMPWTRDDIIGCFAGVRVLKQDTTADATAAPSSVSRDWVLRTAANGVHYSIGGKYTSARQDAAHIVDRVCAELKIGTSCATQDRVFPWSPQNLNQSDTSQHDFPHWSETIQAQAVQLGVDAESALWLIRRHGNKVADILQTLENHPDLACRIIPALPMIEADLLYCATNEMIVHLDDLLRRRLPLLILAKLTDADFQRMGESVAAVLNWDAARVEQEIVRCRRVVQNRY